LFRLASRHQHGDLTIRAFNKRQETENGADWEWWFVHRGRGVGLRVQAKRLFANGTYKSLKSSSSQTKNLIAKAKSGKCYPVFVFYNDPDSVGAGLDPASSLPPCNCRFFYMPSYWGCAVSSAYSIENTSRNGLPTLLPLMRPWHCLLCPADRKALSLPDIVAANLNKEQEQTVDSRITVGTPPGWVVSFLEQAPEATDDGEGELHRYLEERALGGVVLFHAGPEREKV
jgi:hypothetical protein